MDFLSAAWDTIQSRVLHEDSHIHHSHNSYVGYWGKPTSTVDWCEVNYEVTHYVAEFFNTFSSFAMVITGMMGVMFHWRDLENRFLLGFLSVGIVGVGSAAFHGTLLFGLQVCVQN
jgi:dihydroceramidase